MQRGGGGFEIRGNVIVKERGGKEGAYKVYWLQGRLSL